LHKSGQYNAPRYNDLSQAKISQQVSVLQHLKDHKKLTGVVELILNGSKMKVRVNEQSCQLILLLKGIRCLPNDNNFPDYELWSNKALKFSKEHLLQRDISLTIDSVDKKSFYIGSVMLGKQDFGELLVSQGLAIAYGRLGDHYEPFENEARAKKAGIWGAANLNLDLFKGNQQANQSVTPLNQRKSMVLSEIVSLNEFYLQEPNNPILTGIEEKLESFELGSWEKLKRPIKKGTPCVAQFSEDRRFYRAIIEKEMSNFCFVFFMDYGNYD